MFLLLCLCVCVAYAQDAPSVNTTQGVVVGSIVPDGNYLAFYGIPYAGTTSGSNRFKAPTPAPNYPGDFHAIENNVICAQPSSRGLIGIEDCLRLSIHTKNLTTPKPVLVFIEGEEYTSTYKTLFSYTKLVDQNLVVVSMNYRLSIFGFLCLGVPEAPGNAGLKDVVQGLKWIRDNIAGFGGNPNNVVLLGHGSGAAMVDLITMSPSANGLVHKAISLSGSALSPGAIAYEPVRYAEEFGAKLQYTQKSRQELASLLTTTDISLIATQLTEFEFLNNTALFAPCIENANLNDTFLTDVPINLLRSGNYSHIPYIIGYVDREGTIRAEQAALQHWLDKMQANFSNFIQVDLNYSGAANNTNITDSIRNFYFAQRAINMETIEDYLDYHGDTMVRISVMRGAKERALTSTASVRLFEFAYRGTHNSDWTLPQIPLTGVRHGALLNYIFDYDLKPSDTTAQMTLIRRIAAFASSGDPTPSGDPVTSWSPIDKDSTYVLFVGGGEVANQISLFREELQVNLHKMRNDFWGVLYNSYYVAPKPVSSGTSVMALAFIVTFSQMIVNLF